jgi:hypothetical protein
MGWFTRAPSQQKHIEAAIKVATNLYLNTIPEAADAPAPLQFGLPDSRFRYMLFCVSAAVTAILAYDEKKKIQAEPLIKGCLHFAIWTATENTQEYLGDSGSSRDSINDNATAYLQEFLKHWSRWPEFENQGRDTEVVELIASIIHDTESNNPLTESDKKRLGPLALQIDCWLPTMRGAFTELLSR